MADIPSKADIEQLLEKFKNEILENINSRLGENNISSSKWCRSKEAKSILKISDSSLRRLRIKSLIRFKKISGIYLYDISQLNNL